MILLALATSHSEALSGLQDELGRDPANMASSYVPIDSWVYPAFELLAAKGLMQSAFFDLRPWTRLDCARLVEEAEALAEDQHISDDTTGTLHSLRQEFVLELARRTGDRNAELKVESMYQRSTSIAGKPLTDGYHFAETLVNNDGRPFGQGTNLYSGIVMRATAGPFAAYLRTEAQRVSLASAPNAQTLQQIAVADFTPAGAAGPVSGFFRSRLLDANVSFAFKNNQFTFGQQTLWWGPAGSGATLFTNNAEPVNMLRYDRLRPIELPGFPRLLGPIRGQFLVGRLAGAQYVHTAETTFGTPGSALGNQPWIHGEKITFEPTPNFQFGVSRTVLFAGKGAPLTTSTFLRSMFSTGNASEQKDPGDRRSAFDAQYRIPRLRHCLTGYFDGFTDDEPFPLLYPSRSAWLSGFMYRCVPGLPHVTVRAEGLLSPQRSLFPGYYYFNVHYLSGYTNNRQLLGSWIGREAQGEQIWTTWQITPRSSVELSGRSMNASSDFLHGGSLRDLRATAELALGAEWQLHVEDQVEQWHFPQLQAQTQHNNEVTLQLSYRPSGHGK
ncbi:capsule assembly Wzi family protein [Acidipila sp. EB88]|uniref:capsule assembly Wzi family protein n=1 Tax=Acidipila sp. EB88 TaxID=2305226 RepID=UPI0035167DC8